MDLVDRVAEKVAAELNRYAFFYSMKDISDARGAGTEAPAPRAVDSPVALKTGFMQGTLRPGMDVEGEAYLSPFISLHRPRAYYPELLLGGLRASASPGRKGEGGLPHILPVVKLPPLPGGWRMSFLYAGPEGLFTRHEHPRGARDALIRDYARIPLLAPPGSPMPGGWVAFRARLLELRPERLRESVAWERRELEAYALRGLNLFLAVLDEGHGLRELDGGSGAPAGSLFAETRIGPLPHHRAEKVVEECLIPAVEEVFPGRERGDRRQGIDLDETAGHHVLRFRRRLTALIYSPAFAVFRSPSLLGLYLPTDLGEGLEGSEKGFLGLYSRVEKALAACGASPAGVHLDFVHDPGSAAWRERGLLRSELVEEILQARPHLSGVVEWLRGPQPSSGLDERPH
jgi:hypothetical protein